MDDAARLGPAERRRALARMADERFDVVVIGGGVTGTGSALDAATRGLSVALLEQRDFAAGTSSRSSKLIHGGLRYLEQGNFALVREALRERSLLLGRLCPHLVRPVSFLYPLQTPLVERAYVGAGLALYDALARARGGEGALPRHRHLSRRGCLALAPGLRRDALRGGLLYYDAQVDDARHTLAVARTAALHGAALATSVRAVGFVREGERVVGVRAVDLESGAELVVRGRQLVNATGVWTDRVQSLAGRGQIRVRASKGIHLVVPRDRFHADTGLILRTEKSVLFVIPWGRHWIVGTTDTDWDLDLAHPAASGADIDYLLERVNHVLAQPLGRDDIEGVYAGLRPLLHGESEETSKLSREHAVTQSVAGLLTVAGGKYTTYRVMARDAIDAAARSLPGAVAPSCTERIPLVGADGYEALWNRRERLAADWGLEPARVERLLQRHGARLPELIEPALARREWLRPLGGAEDHLAIEIRYAATHEGALHLDDALTRRTRISIETFHRGTACAREAAELLGEVLGWSELDRQREVAHYEARVRAERDSQAQRDDQTADAARLGAPDVRLGRAPATALEGMARA
ncbi:MAG TPA: glycerol-3-phosphate dehydrogenase/oxidase [Myxococcota bacterium]|nr:glycerol-3-phosphate dehydrogenase/oxidase [Myxococcota bacterium]